MKLIVAVTAVTIIDWKSTGMHGEFLSRLQARPQRFQAYMALIQDCYCGYCGYCGYCRQP